MAAAAHLPLFVYNLPNSIGVEITPELMRKIQEGVPQLAGRKHSAPYVPYVRDFAKMGLAYFIGNCRLMLPALTIGAVGCVDGPPNLAPERWVALWKAYRSGNLQEAEATQEYACQVADLSQPFRFHCQGRSQCPAGH